MKARTDHESDDNQPASHQRTASIHDVPPKVKYVRKRARWQIFKEGLAPPQALTLPSISRDFGTSRRQLRIERYTSFARL